MRVVHWRKLSYFIGIDQNQFNEYNDMYSSVQFLTCTPIYIQYKFRKLGIWCRFLNTKISDETELPIFSIELCHHHSACKQCYPKQNILRINEQENNKWCDMTFKVFFWEATNIHCHCRFIFRLSPLNLYSHSCEENEMLLFMHR